jgi:hypothetical protein
MNIMNSTTELKINISLCPRSVPRNSIVEKELGLSCPRLKGNAAKKEDPMGSLSSVKPQTKILIGSFSVQEQLKGLIPDWACAAQGDALLQPIASTNKVEPLDLTTRKFFLVGRHPKTHITLTNYTASRYHALLTHDSNGTCFLFDLKSAQGTFVNGILIEALEWVPVKRGSLVRFGGANSASESFVLKSFRVRIKDFCLKQSMIIDSEGENNVSLVDTCDSRQEDTLVLVHTRLNAISSNRSTTVPLIDLGAHSSVGKKRLHGDGYQSSSRRVKFSTEEPHSVYAPSVTPDELSSDEEDDDSVCDPFIHVHHHPFIR